MEKSMKTKHHFVNVSVLLYKQNSQYSSCIAAADKAFTYRMMAGLP
jgi:hypothetical protein